MQYFTISNISITTIQNTVWDYHKSQTEKSSTESKPFTQEYNNRQLNRKHLYLHIQNLNIDATSLTLPLN